MIARFPWQVQLSQGLPHTNPLKKSWEGVNIFLFLMVHEVTFKGEDYMVNYIDT
jgi:hypothetical protein